MQPGITYKYLSILKAEQLALIGKKRIMGSTWHGAQTRASGQFPFPRCHNEAEGQLDPLDPGQKVRESHDTAVSDGRVLLAFITDVHVIKDASIYMVELCNLDDTIHITRRFIVMYCNTLGVVKKKNLSKQ